MSRRRVLGTGQGTGRGGSSAAASRRARGSCRGRLCSSITKAALTVQTNVALLKLPAKPWKMPG